RRATAAASLRDERAQRVRQALCDGSGRSLRQGGGRGSRLHEDVRGQGLSGGGGEGTLRDRAALRRSDPQAGAGVSRDAPGAQIQASGADEVAEEIGPPRSLA